MRTPGKKGSVFLTDYFPPAPKTMPGIWQHSINVKLMNGFPEVIDWFITKPWNS